MLALAQVRVLNEPNRIIRISPTARIATSARNGRTEAFAIAVTCTQLRATLAQQKRLLTWPGPFKFFTFIGLAVYVHSTPDIS